MIDNGLDQYYTKENISKKCVDYIKTYIDNPQNVLWIEPSAGTGSFIKALHNRYNNQLNIIGYDIDPKYKGIIQADFLDLDKSDFINVPFSIVSIGNPPFGKRSKLAIDFFNECAKFSTYIAMILPVQFRKYSVQNKLDKRFNLIFDTDLDNNSFIYNNKDKDINCCFQIWTINNIGINLRIQEKPAITHPDFEMFLYNNTKQALKFFDKEKYGWQFAVPRQGFYDYTKYIEDEKDLNPRVQYMFFKSSNSNVLENLKKIDFSKLSKNNTTTPGFGKADIVKEYITTYGGLN